MDKSFQVVVEKDESGVYYGSVPLLPGCYSYADTFEELLKNMKEAINLHLSVLAEKKELISTNEVLGLVKVSI